MLLTAALDLLQRQSKKPDSSLSGHERTVQYLQRLGEFSVCVMFNVRFRCLSSVTCATHFLVDIVNLMCALQFCCNDVLFSYPYDMVSVFER